MDYYSLLKHVVYKYGNVLSGIHNNIMLYYSIAQTSVLLYKLMKNKLHYYHLCTRDARLNNIFFVFAFDISVLLDFVRNVIVKYIIISICS